LPWCLSITRNQALRLIGSRRTAAALPDDDEPADPHLHSEEERTVERLDVRRALHALSEDERTLIVLRYGHEWSHPEIAARLEIPVATARVRLHRAQKRLRVLLSDRD
jgi:RNA polymerase sigma-70 factor (ECF subfamily)